MNLGLCCISLELQDRGYKFQTMTYARFSSLAYKSAIDTLASRILNNFVVTGEIIKYCHSVGIKSYRMSSSIAPLLNHPKINLHLVDLPNFSEIYKEIEKIRNIIQNTGVRISAHPGEYISLTSTNNDTINNSIRDLELHGEIFDLLELPKNYNSPLNIHCRQEGSPAEVSSGFARNFEKLSDSVKLRLVVENNDNVGGTWHIANLIEHFYKTIRTPITYDCLHHDFCHGNIPHGDAFMMAYDTWNVVPIFHYSEGIDKTRKHADYAMGTPNDFGRPVYWDVELKAKDLAILKLLNCKS